MHVHVQIVTDLDTPPESDVIRWAQTAASHNKNVTGELTIRIVGENEAAQLNQQWRNRSGATNVLAFPIGTPNTASPLWGDVVICADVANMEARRDEKLQYAHWAHLVIHGVLHLLGYDHGDDEDASEMETLECTMLHDLGYPDPYL
ncbi:MAG: rRNA maturation RNase YbeY [Gammaproteobacteria bacterium]